jgi:hypothetical protein
VLLATSGCEEDIMRRYLPALLLGVVMCGPVMLNADEHHKRYYDPYKKDYHEWNEQEEHAYRHWVEAERHGTYHPWVKSRKEEQREYWRWRHDHPDWH